MSFYQFKKLWNGGNRERDSYNIVVEAGNKVIRKETIESTSKNWGSAPKNISYQHASIRILQQSTEQISYIHNCFIIFTLEKYLQGNLRNRMQAKLN